MSRTEAGAGSALPERCSLDDDPKAGGWLCALLFNEILTTTAMPHGDMY